jgi:elongator complex protein 3
MIFDGIKSEKDLEALKRALLNDETLHTRIQEIRKKVSYRDESITVWDKVAPYVGTNKKKMPTNAELLVLYKEMVAAGEQTPSKEVEQLLRKIKTRSNSGVAVVSLLTKPYACPGRCIYCPTEVNMPKSYLSKEPAAARALANDFDPYQQVTNRIKALIANGHPVEKLEVIVIGGTWSFYHPKYQEEFIMEVFRACNNFFADEADKIPQSSKTIEELQHINETAGVRVIGLSIETRPDHINENELDRLRWLGVTKIEVGVQHLDNDVLAYNKRDETKEGVARATELMRNAGFKVVYHMMPNLPKSTPEMDIVMFRELFNGKSFHPDMLKIYPCIVLDKSLLRKIWEEGGFTPYTDEQLIRILCEVKKHIPPYVRIIRVIRDIPASYILAGSKTSNLRQVIEEDQKKNHWKCHCIRCREVRNDEVALDDYELTRVEYETETGKEIFLSFENKNKEENKCAAFVRLRLPNEQATRNFSGNLEVLKGAALVRELHTYGQLMKIHSEGDQSQHRGFGMRLMEEAERIAKEAGYEKMAVIAGVGVREYYRKKLGYELDRTYMVKVL